MSPSEQLDLLTALDEAEGLYGWIEAQPCPPWPLTTSELAQRARCSVQVMERVLREEEQNGRVQRAGDNWYATAALLDGFARAFGDLSAGETEP